MVRLSTALLSSVLISSIHAAAIEPSHNPLEKRVKHAHCEFILCSGSPLEQALLSAGIMLETLNLGLNKQAKTAWDSCVEERYKPEAMPGLNYLCYQGTKAFAWSARAATCKPGAGCYDFPQTSGSQWNFESGAVDYTKSPSKGIFAHYKYAKIEPPQGI